MQVTTIGLHLAKHWFQVHGVDANGRIVVRRRLQRSGVIPYFRSLAPCLVGAAVAVNYLERADEAAGAISRRAGYRARRLTSRIRHARVISASTLPRMLAPP